MDAIAIAVVALGLVIGASNFRFERFSMGIAWELVASRPGRDASADIRLIKVLMSPAWMVLLVFLGRGLLLAGAVLGFSSYGWPWLITLVVATLGGPAAVLSALWPLPSRRGCIAIAKRQLYRHIENGMNHRDRESQRLSIAVVIELLRLEAIHRTSHRRVPVKY